MFNRFQWRRDDRDVQADVLEHLDGQHQFRRDVPAVGNDPQVHGTQGGGKLINGDRTVEVHAGAQAQALGQGNEFLLVVAGADDVEFQTGDPAIEVRYGPNGQIDAQPPGQGTVIYQVEGVGRGSLQGRRLSRYRTTGRQGRSWRSRSCGRGSPVHQHVALRVIDADDPVRQAAAEGFFDAQHPEHQAGMAFELPGKGFGDGVVDVEDDFPPQEARYDGAEDEEVGMLCMWTTSILPLRLRRVQCENAARRNFR